MENGNNEISIIVMMKTTRAKMMIIRRPRPAGRAPGKPSVPFLGTFRESGELLCICDIACCFSRLGSPLFHFLGLLGSPGNCCAFATLRAVFPDWVHSPRFLPGCGRVHVQGCRDGHFVFASRLGSLSTVFTWLRSRACAGMQGLGVLALVVVAPCGFAAHVASEEAMLSSPHFPHPTGEPSKNAIFLFFVRVRNVKNMTQVAKFAPSLGPVPLPPTPPEPKPLDRSPRALVPSKNAIFLLFVRVRNVKNTTQVAKFAPSLGPVPLPPTPPEPKPGPPPSPRSRA